MSNFHNLYNWQESLYFKLNNTKNCDLNRLLHLHCPSTKALKANKNHAFAQRETLIIRFQEYFNRTLSEGGSQAQLLNLFYSAQIYLKWVDKYQEEAFTKTSVEQYCKHLVIRARRKEIKNTSFSKTRAHLVSLFQALELPLQWFHDVPSLPKNDAEPFEAYSRTDLKQLLPLLRALFKQTSEQFLTEPEKYMRAHKNTSTMSFHYKNHIYQLRCAVSKMIAAATYLLAFYTYANSSVLFSLTRPQRITVPIQEIWYTMPAFKRRAFKIVQLEIGAHDMYIPKYAMSFFDRLLEVSIAIDSSDDSLLLQTCHSNQISPIDQPMLSAFSRKWLSKNFKLMDERNRDLRPVISRFRKTGSQLSIYHQGNIAQGILLDSAPNVLNKHYATGNKLNNQGMTQDVALIRQEQAISKSSAKSAQKALNIDILTVEEALRINIPLNSSANGGRCNNPFGEKSKSFSHKAKRHLLNEGERLACADLIKCFGCPHQVIVQSVEDIWCLLSFKECIEESLYMHLDAYHYKSNFKEIVDFIENNILPKISKQIMKQVEIQFDEIGRHPLWQEAGSVRPLTKIPV
ncbi:hypothetical protein [Shewanella baltica]|uniref:hypothetical protein n=1 Tax=Shewanella baltica TaxID=62322 RepID=UPI00217CEF63|nr:hypothetical protein [Shewanella baltica]MCS6159816.1 hypothetical protein [Shewanella baltica]